MCYKTLGGDVSGRLVPFLGHPWVRLSPLPRRSLVFAPSPRAASTLLGTAGWQPPHDGPHHFVPSPCLGESCHPRHASRGWPRGAAAPWQWPGDQSRLRSAEKMSVGLQQ